MELIGLHTNWTIGFIVTGSILGVALVAVLVGFIGHQINKAKYKTKYAAYEKKLAEWNEQRELEKAAAAKASQRDRYGHNYRDFDYHRYGSPAAPYPAEAGDWFAAWVTAVFAGALGIGIAIIQAIAVIPYDMKYLSWYETTGTVTSIQNILDVGSKTVTNEYIVNLDSIEFPVYMTNSRIMTLEGEEVTLLCEASWVDYGNTADKWQCDIRDAPYVDGQP